ncbi:MAG: type II secretion system F family protein [Magnetospiraceae bacterium]
MRYRYRGVKANGDVLTGALDGASREDAARQVYALGVTPISITPEQSGIAALLAMEIGGGAGLSPPVVTALTRDLAALLAAGLPLARALELLAQLNEKAAARKLVLGVLERVRGGVTLAEALAQWPESFPADYRALVQTGEASGNLAQTLETLAETRARAEALRGQVISALIYPAILLVVAGLTIMILLTLVLPQFEPLFTSAGAQMPLLTRVFMALGDFLGAWWWALLAGVALAWMLFRLAYQRPGFRLAVDAALLRWPVAGPLLARLQGVRFGRAFGMLLAGGVPVPQALDTARAAVTNAALGARVDAAAQGVRLGQPLSSVVDETSGFPILLGKMIRVGEETGALDDMVDRAVSILDLEARRGLERLVSLLVPGITLILGGFVALIVSAILSAMFQANELVF